MIGLASGAASATWPPPASSARFGYDDSLDVFGVHGVGGFVGVVMVGFLAAPFFGGNQAELAIGRQLGVQLGAAVFTIVYTALISWIILKVVGSLLGLRVDDQEETTGLDVVLHDESGYRY